MERLQVFQAFQAAAATVAGKLAIQLPPPAIDRLERAKQTEKRSALHSSHKVEKVKW